MLKSFLLSIVTALALFTGEAEAKKYDIYPVTVLNTIPSEASGIWTPQTDGVNLGLSVTLISGAYYVPASFGLPATCGSYLGIRTTFPRSVPNTTIAGQNDLLSASFPQTFGTPYALLIPGKPGLAGNITFNSFDPVADSLTVTIQDNTTGFNGQIVLRRYLNLSMPTPVQCGQ